MKIRERHYRNGKSIHSMVYDWKGTLQEYAKRNISYPYTYNDKTNEVTVFQFDGKTIYSTLSEEWEGLEKYATEACS